MDRIKSWVLLLNLLFLITAVVILGYFATSSFETVFSHLNMTEWPLETGALEALLHFFVPPIWLANKFIYYHDEITILLDTVYDFNLDKLAIALIIPLILSTIIVPVFLIPCLLINRKRFREPSWILQYFWTTLYFSGFLVLAVLVLVPLDFFLQSSIKISISHVFGKDCPVSDKDKEICKNASYLYRIQNCYDCTNLVPFECCGIDGYTDFLTGIEADANPPEEETTVQFPLSCCRNYSAGLGQLNCTLEKRVAESGDKGLIGATIYTEGCFDKVMKPLESIGPVGQFALKMCLVEFVVFWIILICVYNVFGCGTGRRGLRKRLSQTNEPLLQQQ